MLASVFSGAVQGVDAFLVRVEVDVTKGLPCMHVVGLPENAVREGRERVQAALKNVGVELPARRIIVNLAPADVGKRGTTFDLPLALAVLAAAEKLPAASLAGVCAIGELGLDGEVRPVRGVLPIADRCRQEGVHTLLVPSANAAEACAVDGIRVLPTPTLAAAIAHLRGRTALTEAVRFADDGILPVCDLDYADVKGQGAARRALEIAAAGGHNLLMIGPPGAGKSMLARRMPGILPALTREESIEVTNIYSVAGRLRPNESLLTTRPFRAPHHTTSDAALVGGGAFSRPGEVTLAHRGVLFLDELPEFKRNVLESLRQPLEDATITVGRARDVVAYPAQFMLVAAMNPCPCGYYGTDGATCICSPQLVQRYVSRVSGPLLDRIDLHIHVQPLTSAQLLVRGGGESSAAMRERVRAARARQIERYRERPGVFTNAQLGAREVRQFCNAASDADQVLADAVRRLGFSARAYHRVLRLARTIADLEGWERIERRHVAEAVHYRALDRAT